MKLNGYVQNELEQSNRLQPILAMSLGLQPQAGPDVRNVLLFNVYSPAASARRSKLKDAEAP